MEKLFNLLNDHETGMSKFQDDYFVTTRAGGTLYGQYKQSLRELYKRFRGLRQQISDNKRAKIDLEELEWKINQLKGSGDKTDYFECSRLEIDFQEKSLLMEESERAIADTKREFINFYRQATYLKENIGELTTEKRHQLDIDMWKFKVKEMACIDFVTTGRLRASTFEFINCLPKDLKLQISNEIKDHGKLIEWYEVKEEFHIPEDLSMIEPPNFKQLENLTCENILPM